MVSPPTEQNGPIDADTPVTEIVVTGKGRRAVAYGDPELTEEQIALLTAIACLQDMREEREEQQDIIAALRCLTRAMRRRITLAAEDAAYIVSCVYDSFVAGR